DFPVYFLGGILALWFGKPISVLPGGIVIGTVSYLVIKAIDSDHGALLFCHLFPIAQGAGGNFVKHYILCGPPAQGSAHFVLHLIWTDDQSFFWQVPGSPKGLPPWYDGYFYEGGCMFQHPAYGRMSGLMVGDRFFLPRGNDLVLFLKTAYNSIH